MATLERAIRIAVEAHAGQVDKAGAPYILHPLRVMLSLATDEERIAGVLHDLCEDCPGWTLERLEAEGFSPQVVAAIAAVTRIAGEDYHDFVARAARNAIGRRVKLADLRDNADLSRLTAPSEADVARREKYLRSIAFLEPRGESDTHC